MIDLTQIQTPADFEQAALELFRLQAVACAPYREYLQLLGVDPREVRALQEIPMLPIELFKHFRVYSSEQEPEVIFTSSSTTGKGVSHHPMASLQHYEECFTRAFEHFYGPCHKWSLYALLPNYLEREGSSLVYMVDRLIKRCGSGGFYLYDHQALLQQMAHDPKPKILLGVSYALWDLAEGESPRLKDTIVMETGGMKGRREEISKGEFHKILCESFGVEQIHSEYGMAELTSQAYSKGGNRFYCPPWMAVRVRDINAPQRLLGDGMRGGIDIIDLGNSSSCAFIQTADVGERFTDGSFTIEGRIAHSDIRGCNLLVQ